MKYTLKNVRTFEICPGFTARFVHSENMTLSFVEVAGGADLPEHAHPHEQVLNMLEGQFELTLDGGKLNLSAGDVVVIPSNMPHAGRALTDCRILDVFQPAREDFKNINVN
ncbi:MAG TPA: cupin domain-containing protein [Bacteroidetes bacterium]|nr:cupin domain-containing protein [Bacteroidota bacterium]